MKLWYSEIKTDRDYNENSKTYATLGVLQYLPAQFLWQLLRASVIENHMLPFISGEITEIKFWPKWYKLQNIKAVSNSTYIEPDVFIRFKNFDCIVEVKKTDSSGQHADQWESQSQAYRNEFPEKKTLIYIALGGNHTLDASTHAMFQHVYKATWHRLLHEIDKALQERISLAYKTEASNQEIRILQSTVDAFAQYQEYVVEFLEALLSNNHPISLPTKDTLEQLWKI